MPSIREIKAEFVIKDERDLPKATPEEWDKTPEKVKKEYWDSLREYWFRGM